MLQTKRFISIPQIHVQEVRLVDDYDKAIQAAKDAKQQIEVK